MSFWKNLFGKPDPRPDAVAAGDTYEKEKKLAVSRNPAERLRLAENRNTHQEILYYLAQNDTDPSVRKAVAGNPSTPLQANTVLSSDRDQDVRLALAERLVRLLPDLSHDRQSQLYAFAIETLGTLALDEVIKIRVALSSALKDHADAPPKVVGQLARDIEREVSEPVLRYCIALSDEDLLEILKSHPASWAVQAVAARPQVSAKISRAVVDTEDVPGNVTLLGNDNAIIEPETLNEIVERARTVPQLQKAVAVRKNLPPALIKELAGFVDQSVRNLLLERTDLDAGSMEEIAAVVKRRLAFAEARENGLSAEDRVRRMIADKTLNESSIIDAMGMRDRDFVIVALAAMVRTSKNDMEKIISMRTPKPILAICWKAGLSMRTSFLLQKELALIPPKELIYPRGGTDYPLDKKDLEWQIEFLGLKK